MPHYGLVVDRTDGGPWYVACGGCAGCTKARRREKARQMARDMLAKPEVSRVQLVLVTYSVKEVFE